MFKSLKKDDTYKFVSVFIMIAKVIVDVNVKQLNRPFDYIVPVEFESVIERGARVIVPFGARQLMGFVVDFTDSTDLDAKPIIQLLDVIPALTPELLTLGEQVAKAPVQT
jgi:Primosomal protein N'' (replication factor Y) - superfamily II helicase